MTQIIKLAIAEDHPVMVDGIKYACSGHAHIEIIIKAGNGEELIEKIKKQCPDVVLMDLRMPGMDGMQATKYLKQHYQNIKIIAFTMYDESSLISKMLKLGVDGYLLKGNTTFAQIVDAINTVMRNEFYNNSDITNDIVQNEHEKEKKGRDKKNNLLTTREKEVLQLVCRQFTASQIAEKLFVSERTVENHKRNIFKKLNVTNNVGLVLFAIKNGLMDEGYVFNDSFDSC